MSSIKFKQSILRHHNRLIDIEYQLYRYQAAPEFGSIRFEDWLNQQIKKFDFRPNILFCPQYYKSTNSSYDGSLTPYFDYINSPDFETLSVTPYINDDWYKYWHDDVGQTRQSAFIHYVDKGRYENRLPTFCFEPKIYLNQPEKDEVKPERAYYDFLISLEAGEKVSPNYLYNETYLRYSMGIRGSIESVNLYKKYISTWSEIFLDPTPIFDCRSYWENNKDIQESKFHPVTHFLLRGDLEQRNPSKYFDHQIYNQTCGKEVRASKRNSLEHFVYVGSKNFLSACADILSSEISESGMESVDFIAAKILDGKDTPNFHLQSNVDALDRSIEIGPPFGEGEHDRLLELGRYFEDERQLFNHLRRKKDLATKSSLVGKKPTIRVVFGSRNFLWQGSQNSLFELATGLNSYFDIEALVWGAGDGPLKTQYHAKNIPVIEVPIYPDCYNSKEEFLEQNDRYLDVLRTLCPDIVHVNTLQMFPLAYACFSSGRKYVWNIRESEEPSEYFDFLAPEVRQLAIAALKNADALLFVSRETEKIWMRYLEKICEEGCKPQAYTIHNGLDYTRMFCRSVPYGNRDLLRAAYGINRDEVVFLCTGTVTERKGQIDIVNALNSIDDEVLNNIRIVIIGLSNSKYSNKLRYLVSSFPQKYQDRINLINETRNTSDRQMVLDYYYLSDVFILSSYIESYPRVVLEAIANGLAVISTPCFGAIEQIEEGVSGEFYDYGDINTLGQKISKYATDGSYLSKLKMGSIKSASQKLSYGSMLDGYFEVYRKVSKSTENNKRPLISDIQSKSYSPRIGFRKTYFINNVSCPINLLDQRDWYPPENNGVWSRKKIARASFVLTGSGPAAFRIRLRVSGVKLDDSQTQTVSLFVNNRCIIVNHQLSDKPKNIVADLYFDEAILHDDIKITLMCDKTVCPYEQKLSNDKRQLGLKIWELQIDRINNSDRDPFGVFPFISAYSKSIKNQVSAEPQSVYTQRTTDGSQVSSVLMLDGDGKNSECGDLASTDVICLGWPDAVQDSLLLLELLEEDISCPSHHDLQIYSEAGRLIPFHFDKEKNAIVLEVVSTDIVLGKLLAKVVFKPNSNPLLVLSAKIIENDFTRCVFSRDNGFNWNGCAKRLELDLSKETYLSGDILLVSGEVSEEYLGQDNTITVASSYSTHNYEVTPDIDGSWCVAIDNFFDHFGESLLRISTSEANAGGYIKRILLV